MPPQVNARLTRIVGQGTPDDWDVPGAAGGEKWAGDLDAYYREKVDRVSTDAVDVLVRRTVWVDTAALDGVDLDTDDVVTVVTSHGPITSPARTIARSELAGVPADLATTRIDLEDG